MRPARLACAGAVAAALAGCVSTPAAAPAGPVATTIDVVERDWHTDVCIHSGDANARVSELARGYDGARYLCFGFGDRHYVLTHERGVMTLLSALLPGDGAILMTVLRDTPAAAFGAANVVRLGVSQAGIENLRTFLANAVQVDARGQPVRLGEGPYEGGLFFGATATYAGFYTCNTWTAEALRTAGVPVYGPVLFAAGVMRQVRELAERDRASRPMENRAVDGGTDSGATHHGGRNSPTDGENQGKDRGERGETNSVDTIGTDTNDGARPANSTATSTGNAGHQAGAP